MAWLNVEKTKDGQPDINIKLQDPIKIKWKAITPLTTKPIQTADATMSQMIPEENIGYLRGAALKHLCRFYARSNIRQSIRQKVKWYLGYLEII